jgi:hypothetical protein
MTNCIYNKTNGSCAHPGNRKGCVAEGTRKSLPNTERVTKWQSFIFPKMKKIWGQSQKNIF